MAVGLPLKTTYANGDVYSASDVNDTNGTINLLQTSTLSIAAGKNSLINGGMDVWQRGTSISLAASTAYASGFTSDRWQAFTSANQACTISRQATGDTTNLPNIQYCLRFQRNSGQTGTAYIPLAQNIETLNSVAYAGKTVTLSFYARKGANYSPASSALSVTLFTGTGTDQNIYGTYTGAAYPIDSTATLTTTWQRFTFTATLSSSLSEIGLRFAMTPVGTAGAADYYEITGVQLELGSVATTFSRAGGTIQGELAACQRYYLRIKGTGANYPFGMAQNYTTSTGGALVPFPVVMRTRPTALETSGSGGDYQVYTASGTAQGLASAPTYAGVATTEQTGAVNYTTTLTNLVAGNANQLTAQTSSGFLGWSAEL